MKGLRQLFAWRLPKAMQQERETKVKGQKKFHPSVLGGVQRSRESPEVLSENVIVSGSKLAPVKSQNTAITSCPCDSYLRGECYPVLAFSVSALGLWLLARDRVQS